VPFLVFAEFIGTFWLVLGGCGSAVLADAFPHVGSDPWPGGLAANGFGDHSPGHYSLAAGWLTLTLIHLISIPVTNTSVNPARRVRSYIDSSHRARA
jgi:glycerol uptake facilitator-like aquaporin